MRKSNSVYRPIAVMNGNESRSTLGGCGCDLVSIKTSQFLSWKATVKDLTFSVSVGPSTGMFLAQTPETTRTVSSRSFQTLTSPSSMLPCKIVLPLSM